MSFTVWAKVSAWLSMFVSTLSALFYIQYSFFLHNRYFCFKTCKTSFNLSTEFRFIYLGDSV